MPLYIYIHNLQSPFLVVVLIPVDYHKFTPLLPLAMNPKSQPSCLFLVYGLFCSPFCVCVCVFHFWLAIVF